MLNLTQLMNERKSVRVYDSSYKMEKSEILEMLDLATSAPSSSNLQPWRFIVIQKQEIKEGLRTFGNNAANIRDASAVIAVLGDIEAYKNSERIYKQNATEGHIPLEQAIAYSKNVHDMYASFPTQYLRETATHDAGLISMQLLLIAKERGYDTVIMGGFDKEEFAKQFELPDNIIPITLIALGKAAGPAFGTSRIPAQELSKFY